MKTYLKALSIEMDPAEIRLIVKRMGGGQNSLKNLRAFPLTVIKIYQMRPVTLILLAGQYL